MRKIRYIVLHCSASEWGDADVINEWHKERGFDQIGYHFVVLNGYHTYKQYKTEKVDVDYVGKIEKGRNIEKPGAHVKGMNSDSIGICMIGNETFHKKQIRITKDLIYRLMREFKVPITNVIGHYETETGATQGKTCPNYDMTKVRSSIKLRTQLRNVFHPKWFFDRL